MELKKCTLCKKEKHHSFYHKDASRKDGLANKCKSCRCKYDEVIFKNCRACGDLMQLQGLNKAQVYCGKTCQSMHLKFGIDEYKIEDLKISQDFKCAICKQELSNVVCNVDHCHSTGHVRGVLCTPCNTAIGFLNDNVEHLSNAIKYLNLFNKTKPTNVKKEFTGSLRYRRKKSEYNRSNLTHHRSTNI